MHQRRNAWRTSTSKLQERKNQRGNDAGGPRFWRERFREMQSFDSVCAAVARCATKPAKITWARGGAKVLPCVATIAAGLYGHFSAAVVNCGSRLASRPRSAMLIMQWCFPLRRQHAGRFVSLLAVGVKSGGKNGRPSKASNVMAIKLRKVSTRALATKYASSTDSSN
jgi:hypothetical protein